MKLTPPDAKAFAALEQLVLQFSFEGETLHVAYAFGVKKPIAHVMGYFVSILRERIATFEAPAPPKADDPSALHNLAATAVIGISIKQSDTEREIRARLGVVLATGGGAIPSC